MPVSRRKQAQPRRVDANLEAVCSGDTGSPLSTDMHVCGDCGAEFRSINSFVEHKQSCSRRWDGCLPGSPDSQVVDLSNKPDRSNGAFVDFDSSQQVGGLNMIQQMLRHLESNGEAAQNDTASVFISPPSSNEALCARPEQRAGCPLCARSLPGANAAVLWHLLREHGADRPLGCVHCDAHFAQPLQLAVHHRHSHGNLAADAKRSHSVGPVFANRLPSHAGRQTVPPESVLLAARQFHLESPDSSDLQLQMNTPVSQGDDAKERPLDLSWLSNTFLPSFYTSASSATAASQQLPQHLATSSPLLDDNDWEKWIEVESTDEAEKIRQLIGDRPQPPTTDPNQCIICRRILSCKSALQMHYRTHTGERPFKCRVCRRAFTTKGNLKTHMGIHRTKHAFGRLGSTPESSSETAPTTVSVAEAAQTPLDVGPTSAPIEMALPSTASLPRPIAPKPTFGALPPTAPPMTTAFTLPFHNALPTNAPPFSNGLELAPLPPLHVSTSNGPMRRASTTCNICFKMFACQSALEIHYRYFHMRSHTKERPFKCEVCGRGFSTKGNMKQHMLTHKIRDMTSQCSSPMVGVDEPIVTSAASHDAAEMFSMTQQQLVPPVDAAPGPSPLEQIKQMWDRAVPTPTRRAPLLAKHQCGVCYKHFSSSSALQIHMRTHTGDKPFKCEICERAFTTKGNLKVHMSTHWCHSPTRRGRRIFDLVSSEAIKQEMNGAAEEHNHISCLNENKGSSAAVVMQRAVVSESTPEMGAKLFQPYAPMAELRRAPPPPPPPFGAFNGAALSAFGGAPPPFALFSPPPPLPPLLPPTEGGAPHPMDAVMWMWRNVCSVCHRVFGSSAELEEHLKSHLNGVHYAPTAV